MVILDSFRERYSQLTRRQREIFEYMIDNPKEVSYLSLKELSKRIGASEVSVLRVCKELGFGNFIGLKNAFRSEEQLLYSTQDIENMSHSIPPGSQRQKKELFKMICSLERKNMENMINGIDIDMMFKCAKELLKAQEIVIFGHNASKNPADCLANRLNYFRLKATAVKLEENASVNTTLARIGNKDFVIVFSFPSYYSPITEVINFVQMRGARVITITDSMKSPAVTESGYTFLCRTEAPFFYNALSIPMMFVELLTSCMAIQMGDQLYRIKNEELMVSKYINDDN